MDVPTVHIFGVPFSKLSMNDTVNVLSDAIASGQPHQVITANPIMVMHAIQDPAYLDILQQAELVVPDGTGIVWAASYVGNAVAERVPGFDLMHRLLEVGDNHRWKVFLLGAAPEVIKQAETNLKLQYPLIRWVGARDGYFKDEDNLRVIEEIKQSAPDILLVGRSATGQEPWINKYKAELGVPLIMGVGGSFDVISGKLKRAPVLFQKLRLEWFYRLMQEPWRFKRMLDLPKFAFKVIREKENVQKH